MPIMTTMSQDGKGLTIQIPSRFDFSLQGEFRQAYEKHKAAGARYVLDFSATEYLDSSALGMLLILRQHAGGERADIRIRNCKPGITKILKVANFQRLFTLEEAAA
jgi:anti-anti-sigma factor